MVDIPGREKILLHLMNQQDYKEGTGEVPYRICQRGIAEHVSLSRNRVSELLRELVKNGEVEEGTRHVVGLKRRRKVYFPSGMGRKRARDIRDDLKDEEVKVRVGEEEKERKVTLKRIDRYIETSDPLLSALNMMEDEVIDLTESDGGEKDVFVGREEEMDHLKEHLNEVKEKGASTVFVTGPAGIGKTRLVSEFKQDVAKKNFEFLTGRSFYETSEPYRPFREAFDRYETIASMLGPEKVSDRKDVEDKKRFDAERHAEWYETAQEVKETAAERPLVLFLDDVQWADRSTLELLHYLTVELTDSPVLFIGAYRPEDLDKDHPMKECRDRMVRENIFNELRLEPLDWEDTKRIVKNQIGAKSIPDDFVKLVHQTTEGNPLFTRECINQMLEDGTLKPRKNEYPESEDALDIPEVVESVIQRRVKRLGDETQKILSKASVIGEEFSFELLQEVTGLSELELLDHLDILVDTGLIEDDPMEEVFSFSHTLIHLSVYEDISPKIKRGYHRVVGKEMEQLYEGELESIHSDLGYHFEMGQEMNKAVGYYLKAGEEAKRVYAHEDAIEIYHNILDILDEYPDASMDRPEVLEALGDTYKIIGKYEQAETCFQGALDETTEREKQGRSYRKIAESLKKRGDYDKAGEFIERGLSLIEDDQTEGCKLLAQKGLVSMRRGDYTEAIRSFKKEKDLAEKIGDSKDRANALHDLGTIHLKKGEFAQAEGHLEKAIELREELEDMKGLGKSIGNLAAIYIYKGELDKALEHQKRSLDINEKRGDKLGMAGGLHNLGNIYLDKGKSEKALEVYERGLKIRKEIGDKLGISGSLNNIGNLYQDKGDLKKALEYHERSLDISEQIGDREGIANSFCNMSMVYHYMGELDEALEYQQRSLAIRKEIEDKQSIANSLTKLGTIYLRMNDLTNAQEQIEQSLELAEEIGKHNLSALNLARMAEVMVEEGNLDKAEKKVEEALKITHKFGLRWEEGMCRMVCGILYRKKEGWDESMKQFEKALEILEETADREELARAHREYGLMFKAKGERKKAERHLKKALSMSEEMGMDLWTGKVKDNLDSLS